MIITRSLAGLFMPLLVWALAVTAMDKKFSPKPNFEVEATISGTVSTATVTIITVGTSLMVNASAYDHSAACTGKWSRHGKTASGRNARTTVGVAADTRVFPFKTILDIEGVGVREVDDRGGAIKGNRIDIRFIGKGSYHRALAFGRKQLKVTVLYMPKG